MYRYSQPSRQTSPGARTRMRVVAALLILALLGCAALGVACGREKARGDALRAQLAQRIRSSCSDARSLADRLPSSLASDSASRLAAIQQCVYAMDQMNSALVTVYGESARIVPAEAFSALYEDLQTYFSIILTNTSSVLETRTLLINHLTALQNLLAQ